MFKLVYCTSKNDVHFPDKKMSWETEHSNFFDALSSLCEAWNVISSDYDLQPVHYNGVIPFYGLIVDETETKLYSTITKSIDDRWNLHFVIC